MRNNHISIQVFLFFFIAVPIVKMHSQGVEIKTGAYIKADGKAIIRVNNGGLV